MVNQDSLAEFTALHLRALRTVSGLQGREFGLHDLIELLGLKAALIGIPGTLELFRQDDARDPAVREKVLSKTDGRCFYCGELLRTHWHVDHFIPKSRGGDDSLLNYVAACPSCNLQKHDRYPSDEQTLKFMQMEL